MPICKNTSSGYALHDAAPSPPPSATAEIAAAIKATPGSVSIYGKPHIVRDQGEVPCCVSCSLTGAMEILHGNWPELAPLFHYYTATKEGVTDSQGNMEIAKGYRILMNNGICSRSLHPYPIREDHIRTVPSANAVKDANRRRLFKYQVIYGIKGGGEMRDRLRMGFPVVIGFRRPLSFPRGVLNSNNEWKDPEALGSSFSGHCVLVTGYNDVKGFRIYDSEGAEKYDHGGWWMSYEVVNSRSPLVVVAAYYLRR